MKLTHHIGRNTSLIISLSSVISVATLFADPASDEAKALITPEKVAEGMAKHEDGAQKLADEQDDLSADVQDLIDEQTDAEVIELLQELEVIMADATDLLEKKKTGGETIATETEIIEKIFEAAKKKQQKSEGSSQSSQQSMGSMLQMMQNMMNGGKDVGEGQQPENNQVTNQAKEAAAAVNPKAKQATQITPLKIQNAACPRTRVHQAHLSPANSKKPWMLTTKEQSKKLPSLNHPSSAHFPFLKKQQSQ